VRSCFRSAAKWLIDQEPRAVVNRQCSPAWWDVSIASVITNRARSGSLSEKVLYARIVCAAADLLSAMQHMPPEHTLRKPIPRSSAAIGATSVCQNHCHADWNPQKLNGPLASRAATRAEPDVCSRSVTISARIFTFGNRSDINIHVITRTIKHFVS